MLRVPTLNKMWHILLFSLIGMVVCPLLMDTPAHSQRSQFNESQVKSAFLFNLTKFVFWPDGSFKTDDSPFIITILGNDPFGQNLEDIVYHEKVGTHSIVIQRIHRITDLKTAHILYIHRSFADELVTIIDRSAQTGLLTVSDYSNFATQGGAVNFLIRNSHLTIELNLAAAGNNGLKFSSKLLQLARIIESEKP